MDKQELPKNIRVYRDVFQGRKTVDGKKIVVYGKTIDDCVLRLNDATAQHRMQLYIEPSKNSTFGEWLYIWLHQYKKNIDKLAKSSLYQLQNCIDKHTPIRLKNTKLKNLTAYQIDLALCGIESSRMRKYTYGTLMEALDKAYRMELISKKLSDFVEPIKHICTSGVALTLKEQEQFLLAIQKSTLQNIFKFYLYTGVRRSEATFLLWGDIDFDKRCMFVSGTKTRHSRRYVPLCNLAYDLLKSMGAGQDPTQRLFTYPVNYINKKLREVWTTHTIKDSRHTFATRCHQSGIPVNVYKLWLGHSRNSKVAETIYTHYNESHFTEMKKFNLTPEVDSIVLDEDYNPTY